MFYIKRCPNCNKKIDKNTCSCPYCGEFLQAKNIKSMDKKRINAALLSFVFGMFGVQKFYLGEQKKGFLYLLFCWTIIPLILGFIEGIYFFSITDEKFNEKYN